MEQLLQSWPSLVDSQERTRRLIDLCVVSVLLDAGAGNRWKYRSKESGKYYSRSEGLAVASFEMFKSGFFSSDPAEPCVVDAAGLARVTVDRLAKALQVTEENPLIGLQGRAELLNNLSTALDNHPQFFEEARPGSLVDYLLAHPSTVASSIPIVPITTLWTVLSDGFDCVWPQSRTQLDGVSLGDAWVCSDLNTGGKNKWESIVPFHKPTQWLCYSIMVPMARMMNIYVSGSDLLTGLPEYRNGGLFIDTGLLNLKEADLNRGIGAYKVNATVKGQPNVEVVPLFEMDDDVIAEWRAVTVGLLDDLLIEVNSQLGLNPEDRLTLPQMLEAGTWKVCSEPSFPPCPRRILMNVSVCYRADVNWLPFQGPIPEYPRLWYILTEPSFDESYVIL